MSRATTVLVSVPHGVSAGNMLRHGLIDRLLAADAAPEVVIVSPLSRDPGFVRELSQPRVLFEDLPAHRPAGLEARLLALMQAAYLESGVTESVKIRRQEARANGVVRWLGAKARLARAFAPSLTRPATRYDLSDRLVSHPHADALFEKYGPALLVASSPGLIFSEVPLLRTAARRRVRAVAIDPSWDNFTNKLLPVRRVDRLLVWNELMRDQAADLHGYQPDTIRLCGAPQFDGYFRYAGTPRDEFFRRIGADPARKLIALTTTPRELYRYHPDVLRGMAAAVESGAVGPPSQILVRLHPRDDEAAYADVRHLPHVIVEKPFRSTVKVADGLAVDVMPEHQRHLADTMRHSDVVVNVASTITLEACVFDTPVVNIAFDGEAAGLPYERSARRYYAFTHYVNVTRHDAVRVAWNAGELVESIARYLADPALNAAGRRRVVEEQVRFVDGRSGERVAGAVVDELADALGAPARSTDAQRAAAPIMAPQ